MKDLNHFLILSKKYKFDYFIHGDDWKKEPQSGIRSEVKKLLKNGMVRLLIFRTQKIFLQRSLKRR